MSLDGFLARWLNLWRTGPFTGASRTGGEPCVGLPKPDGRVLPLRRVAS